MSYYKYMVSVYRSSLPSRSLRSSSVERTMPLDSARFLRAATVGPCCGCSSYYGDSGSSSSSRYSSQYGSLDQSVMPFNLQYQIASAGARARASSVQPVSTYQRSYFSSPVYGGTTSFDYKVMDYASRLDQEEATRKYINTRRVERQYDADSYRSKYDSYSNRRFDRDYLYKTDDLSSYKHYRKSNATLNDRCARAKSPMLSREIDRYYKTERRSDYMGDISSGPYRDFRYYNYRSVPYYGGSDHYSYVPRAIRTWNNEIYPWFLKAC